MTVLSRNSKPSVSNTPWNGSMASSSWILHSVASSVRPAHLCSCPRMGSTPSRTAHPSLANFRGKVLFMFRLLLEFSAWWRARSREQANRGTEPSKDQGTDERDRHVLQPATGQSRLILFVPFDFLVQTVEHDDLLNPIA